VYFRVVFVVVRSTEYGWVSLPLVPLLLYVLVTVGVRVLRMIGVFVCGAVNVLVPDSAIDGVFVLLRRTVIDIVADRVRDLVLSLVPVAVVESVAGSFAVDVTRWVMDALRDVDFAWVRVRDDDAEGSTVEVHVCVWVGE